MRTSFLCTNNTMYLCHTRLADYLYVVVVAIWKYYVNIILVSVKYSKQCKYQKLHYIKDPEKKIIWKKSNMMNNTILSYWHDRQQPTHGILVKLLNSLRLQNHWLSCFVCFLGGMHVSCHLLNSLYLYTYNHRKVVNKV